MANSVMTVTTVEARAVSVPNYLGLPQANHIFLVSLDRSFGWTCFGSYDPPDAGKLVNTSPIYKEWALELAPELARPGCNPLQYMAGVANRVNGTCHTLSNRILALSSEDSANVSNSIDDPYSVVVFGKYGFGTNQFCDLLTQSFNKVSQPNSLLDKVLERARSPYKDELDAWKIVIYEQLKINISHLLEPSPGLADKTLAVMASYCMARDAMYEQCFDYKQGRAPNKDEIAQIRTRLKELALEYVENVLNALTVSNRISPQQKNAFESVIKGYVDRIVL